MGIAVAGWANAEERGFVAGDGSVSRKDAETQRSWRTATDARLLNGGGLPTRRYDGEKLILESLRVQAERLLINQ